MKNFDVDIKKFEETLLPRVDIEDQKIPNQIFYAILCALRVDKDGCTDIVIKQNYKKLLTAILLKIF